MEKDWPNYTMSNNFRGDKDFFTSTLVSAASTNIFFDSTLAKSKNLLSKDTWWIVTYVVTFPTHFNKVTDIKKVYYKKNHN